MAGRDDGAVARRAAAQLGLVTRAQCLAAGWSRSTVDRRLAAGRLAVVHPGVYRIPGAPVTWEHRVLAACLATGGLAAHGTAAALWCLDGCRPGRIRVVVAHARGVTAAGVLVHRSRQPRTPAHVGPIPVTVPAWTLLDMAGDVPARRLEAALDDALRRGLATPDVLKDLIRHLGQGRRGAGRLRGLLEERTATDSPLEHRFLQVLLRAGLPTPHPQYEVRHRGRLVARVDFAYPDHRIAMEVDGYTFHTGRSPYDRDRERQNRLVNLGWRPLRFTARHIASPRGLVAAVTRALAVEVGVSSGGSRG